MHVKTMSYGYTLSHVRLSYRTCQKIIVEVDKEY
jgi:hypothetical protein